MASNWKAVDMDDIDHCFPSVAACYAVYCNGRLCYVGSTENLRDRMRGHGIEYARYSASINTPWGTFDSVKVKYRPFWKYGDWAMRELRLIRKLQPLFNRLGVSRKTKCNIQEGLQGR